jgi:hypothetical protein
MIKGNIRGESRRYLFASLRPGCQLDYRAETYGSRVKAKVWFIRQERRFLRPTYDGDSPPYLGLFKEWGNTPNVYPLVEFGRLLLTPDAAVETLDDFADVIWDYGDIACSALGRATCVAELRRIGELEGGRLRELVCTYLKAQHGAPCVR